MKKRLLPLLFALAAFSLQAQTAWKESLNTLPVFDAKYYSAKYADVSSSNAAESWQKDGLIKGRVGSAVFDPVYYLQQNPDVIKKINGPTDYVGAALHWLEYGIQEGRPSHPEFNIKYYVKNNQDLYQAYGVDFRKLIEHYLTEGRAARRKATP